MPNLHPMPRSGKAILAAAILVFILGYADATAPASGPSQQQLELHDPTPRPPDLEKQYATDPAEQARQREMAAIRTAQLRLHVIAATDKLVQLAQKLEADAAKPRNSAAMTSQASEASQIEKLARTIKESTKAQ